MGTTGSSRIRRLGQAIGVAAGGAALIATIVVAQPANAGPPLVVDDDRQQCGSAAYTSIGSALDAAPEGATIQVCPGVYREMLNVTKSVKIVGAPEAVSGLECLTSAPARRDDLDVTRVPILELPVPEGAEAYGPAVVLDADGIEFAGMVVQGVLDPTPVGVDGYPLYVPALASSDSHSGYSIHDNLFRLNTLGVELGAGGDSPTRFAGNCLRDNEYGLSNQSQFLRRAVIDGNTVIRTAVVGIEVGSGFRGSEQVTVRANRFDANTWGVIAENAKDVRLVDNLITRTTSRGIWITSGNDGVDVVGNVVEGVAQNATSPVGISFSAAQLAGVALPRTTDVEMRGNIVTGMRVVNASGVAIGVGANIESNGLDDALITDNRFTGNGRAGLTILPGNSRNLVRDNVATDNSGFGIRVQGTTSLGNRFIANVMTGNALADAQDDTDLNPADGLRLLSEWRDNQCVTDVPVGALCRAE